MIDNNEPLLDIVSIPLDLLIKQDELKSPKIGIGDEVFITGLFTYAPGRQRNMPILRHGNIAMIPGEQIETDDGYADVYLIEVRSIGGLSGSPVFVRETIKLSGERDAGDPGELHGLGRTYLLGLVHGHWDINESEINNPNAPHDPRRGVNLGIAIVVPADKIIEIINRPELKARRAEEEECVRQAGLLTPD